MGNQPPAGDPATPPARQPEGNKAAYWGLAAGIAGVIIAVVVLFFGDNLFGRGEIDPKERAEYVAKADAGCSKYKDILTALGDEPTHDPLLLADYLVQKNRIMDQQFTEWLSIPGPENSDSDLNEIGSLLSSYVHETNLAIGAYRKGDAELGNRYLEKSGEYGNEAQKKARIFGLMICPTGGKSYWQS